MADAPLPGTFNYFVHRWKTKNLSAMSNKINKAWHEKNRMPKNATLDQRVDWHIAHQQHCQCRSDMPENIKAEIEKRKKK
jgi:hypothetical protein